MKSENVGTDVLRTLHRLHRQLTDLRGRQDRGPKQVHAAESHVQVREAQLAEAREEAKTVRLAADAKQLLLKAGEQKVLELQVKLNTAATNREYQALKDQIAAQKMTNSVLDDEILERWEKIEQVQGKMPPRPKRVLAQARQKAEAVRQEVQQEEPLIRAEIERLQGELKQCEAELPTIVRDFYQRVVRQKGEDALAIVENQICGGCHQQIPLNVCAEIMMSHPTFCKSCGRLLYMPEDHMAKKPQSA